MNNARSHWILVWIWLSDELRTVLASKLGRIVVQCGCASVCVSVSLSRNCKLCIPPVVAVIAIAAALRTNLTGNGMQGICCFEL